MHVCGLQLGKLPPCWFSGPAARATESRAGPHHGSGRPAPAPGTCRGSDGGAGARHCCSTGGMTAIQTQAVGPGGEPGSRKGRCRRPARAAFDVEAGGRRVAGTCECVPTNQPPRARAHTPTHTLAAAPVERARGPQRVEGGESEATKTKPTQPGRSVRARSTHTPTVGRFQQHPSRPPARVRPNELRRRPGPGAGLLINMHVRDNPPQERSSERIWPRRTLRLRRRKRRRLS